MFWLTQHKKKQKKKKQIDHPINENENQIKWMKNPKKKENRRKMKNKEAFFLFSGVGRGVGLCWNRRVCWVCFYLSLRYVKWIDRISSLYDIWQSSWKSIVKGFHLNSMSDSFFLFIYFVFDYLHPFLLHLPFGFFSFFSASSPVNETEEEKVSF